MRRCILAAFVILFLLEVASCLVVDVILTASRACAAEGTTKQSIESLIADLGSDRLEIREAAERALITRDVEAIPALRKALPKARLSKDLDMRRRVEDILHVVERYRAIDALSKAKALGQAGRAVEVADRLAMAAKYRVNANEGWECLTQLAAQAIEPMDRYFAFGWTSAWKQQLPVGEFRRYLERFNPKEIAKSKIDIDEGKALFDFPRDPKQRAAYDLIRQNRDRVLLRGEEVSLIAAVVGVRNGMIAASGDVHVSLARDSVIVAGGDVKIERMPSCILICDGDLELLYGRWLSGSIIVARGKVTCKKGEIKGCLVRTGHTLLLPIGVKIDLKDGTPDPLAFVKFFELTDVGLAAEDAPPRDKSDARVVRLKEVRKESPFAAGLRAGDVITAIEERKTPTTEVFRRILRRKLAEGGPIITFSVRRSGKPIEVDLPVKD